VAGADLNRLFYKVGDAAVFLKPPAAVAILFKLSVLPVQQHWLVFRNLNLSIPTNAFFMELPFVEQIAYYSNLIGTIMLCSWDCLLQPY